MGNNLENKAKFFALYWRQRLMREEMDSKLYFCKPSKDSDFALNYLELKPLSSISDEDARFLGYSDAKSATTTYFKTLGKNTNDADYLRSRGYALPWMWLSVEEQINRGWVKLKGETK